MNELRNSNLRLRLDPEYYWNKAQDDLLGIDAAERRSWFQHPCTQSLLHSLEGDILGVVLIWLNGGYAEDMSADATAQAQAKAKGMAQAVDQVIMKIHDISKGEEDDQTGGTQSPN